MPRYAARRANRAAPMRADAASDTMLMLPPAMSKDYDAASAPARVQSCHDAARRARKMPKRDKITVVAARRRCSLRRLMPTPNRLITPAHSLPPPSRLRPMRGAAAMFARTLRYAPMRSAMICVRMR